MKLKRMFFCALLALLGASANADPILIVDPVPTGPEIGSQVVVNVSVDPDGFIIGDYIVSLLFDDLILSFFDIAFGSALDGPLDSDQFFDFGPGFVDVEEFSFAGIFAGQDGATPFSLFDITFDVIDTGFTDLTLDVLTIGDDFGLPIEFFDVEDSSLTAVPVAVPEPGTLALFGMGLIGLGLARRRAA